MPFPYVHSPPKAQPRVGCAEPCVSVCVVAFTVVNMHLHRGLSSLHTRSQKGMSLSAFRCPAHDAHILPLFLWHPLPVDCPKRAVTTMHACLHVCMRKLAADMGETPWFARAEQAGVGLLLSEVENSNVVIVKQVCELMTTSPPPSITLASFHGYLSSHSPALPLPLSEHCT